jgi:hypothetical protein
VPYYTDTFNGTVRVNILARTTDGRVVIVRPDQSTFWGGMPTLTVDKETITEEPEEYWE